MNFEAILDRFQARRSGSGFMAKCPAHEDRNPSLSITQENGRILVHCHAGCATRDVLGAIGMTLEDLFEGDTKEPKLVATYDYVDERGVLLFQVCRYDPKAFKQRRPAENGEWSWHLNGARRVLFRLPAILQASYVVIVEGEKDVQAAEKFGLTATCNAGGAGKWKDEYSEFLCGKHVTIIPDNDEPGRKHADQVAKSVLGKAASVAICYLPEGIKDLSEWPLSRESLVDLIKKSPPWTSDSADASLFQNMRDYEEAAPLKFAIESFLQENAVNAIAGLPGHGKTWLALSVTRALLFGPGKLWDLFNVIERAERVIYLIPESTIGPFKFRLEKLGLYDEIRNGRLLTRTLSKGPTPSLQDARLLRAAKNAHVVCDTGIRFMLNIENENSASEAAKGLSEDFFALLRAEAKSVLALFHSPKSFNGQDSMTLESMIRGSGEFGAMVASAWGIKQIDRVSNTVHMENLKARDFEPSGPFEIIGRPHIDQAGDFALHKRPDECGTLAEEQPDLKGANSSKQASRAANIELVKGWVNENPEPSTSEIRQRFDRLGINVNEATIRGYKSAVRKGPK